MKLSLQASTLDDSKRGAMKMPQRSQAVAKTIRYSPQTDCKALETQLIKHAEGKLLPIQSTHPYWLLFFISEVSLHGLKRER